MIITSVGSIPAFCNSINAYVAAALDHTDPFGPSK